MILKWDRSGDAGRETNPALALLSQVGPQKTGQKPVMVFGLGFRPCGSGLPRRRGENRYPPPLMVRMTAGPWSDRSRSSCGRISHDTQIDGANRRPSLSRALANSSRRSREQHPLRIRRKNFQQGRIRKRSADAHCPRRRASACALEIEPFWCRTAPIGLFAFCGRLRALARLDWRAAPQHRADPAPINSRSSAGALRCNRRRQAPARPRDRSGLRSPSA